MRDDKCKQTNNNKTLEINFDFEIRMELTRNHHLTNKFVF